MTAPEGTTRGHAAALERGSYFSASSYTRYTFAFRALAECEHRILHGREKIIFFRDSSLNGHSTEHPQHDSRDFF